MAPVTEVVPATLKRDADTAVMAAACASLGAQPGCGSGGTRTRRTLFISRDDIESHRAFEREAEVHAAVLGQLGRVLEAFETPFHVVLRTASTSEPAAVAAVLGGGNAAGVAVLAKAYFLPGNDELAEKEREMRVEAAFLDSFVCGAGFGAAGFTGEVAGGWSVEDDIEYWARGAGCSSSRSGGGRRSRLCGSSRPGDSGRWCLGSRGGRG
ncbi:hypothetical protein F5X97DRAFT_342418 [Nemania serpens]|nr:hypothetical protein F5X97DRAFT_342418 [Nemania serpens]